MNPYGLDMNDPRVQQLLMQMRAQQGGGFAPNAAPAGVPAFRGAPSEAPIGVPPPQLQNGPQPSPMPNSEPALDPRITDAVLSLQGQGTQRAALDRQYKLAEQMRASAKDQLKSSTVPGSTGGIVVAPSWLNAASAIGQNWKAGRVQDAADASAKNLDAQRQTAARGFLAVLSRGNEPKRRPDDEASGTGWSDY